MLKIKKKKKTHSSVLNILIMCFCKHCEAKAAEGDDAGDWGGVWYGCMGSSSSKKPEELPEDVRGYLIILGGFLVRGFFSQIKFYRNFFDWNLN